MIPRHHSQQGIVLIVVMIMLVIIGLTSVAVMREALDADMISNNVRAESVATEAAQVALAFCEQQLAGTGGTLTIQPAVVPPSPANWEVFNNWKGANAMATTLDISQLKSSLAAVKLSKLPQCLAEDSSAITGSGRVVLVTARGFSQDYTEDSTTGRSLSGSAVWLQSTVRLQ